MNSSSKKLLDNFKKDPVILDLLAQGNLEKVARLATAMGTAGGSPELRRYGKDLWDKYQGQL